VTQLVGHATEVIKLDVAVRSTKHTADDVRLYEDIRAATITG
jgi:hypothetical protein